ncbi:MAG TPA: tetratricopeptide repeat protein [Gammaproteobacteria bacterium]|nr:tetratricopeptide repeat protein [Gammaproteobacteria bacterium]
MGSRTVYLLLVATAAFGPLGVLGTMFTILMHSIYRRFSTDFNDWYSGLFPEDPPDEISELAEFLEAHSRLSGANIPDSFRDILANGTQQQKRDAVVLMAKHFRPSFAPAMRSALVDQDSSIRILAASLITNIEKEFQNKTMRVDRAVAESPDSVKRLLEQARLYDDYAFTGLLEEDREEANRERARRAYEKVLKLQPDNRDAALALGRLLVRSGDLEEALEWLQQAPQYQDGEPQLMLWYAECLYRLGRFQELRELLREHGTAFVDGPGKRRPRIADAVQMWMGRGAPTA